MTIDPNSAEAEHNSANQFNRVRNHTAPQVNANIDQTMLDQVREYVSQPPESLAARIEDLEREWDTERVLEANASTLAFVGLLLGFFVHPNWFGLTAVVLLFLFQHAVQGWCPPLAVIRRLGVRTRNEIDQEKYALKTLRGDFELALVPNGNGLDPAEVVLQAVTE